ncbi:MAG: UbiH/UbiF/VisC/COQ6 family ubiquinone biosynthesis hydroxylase [Geminicoccaceae bacterium]
MIADVIVVGSGLSGLALTCALGQAGVRVSLVDRRSRDELSADGYDRRTTAVALVSRRLLERIGVWPDIAPHGEPILDIEVSEGASPLRVHYDHSVVGDEPFGHIVDNAVLRRAMFARAASLDTVQMHLPATVTGIERSDHLATVLTDDGQRLPGRLVAAADGKLSAVREMLGVPVRKRDYGQIAQVFNLKHSKPHRGRAVERFFPDGPFAMLPMQNNGSSVVWALRRDIAEEIMAMNDADFVAEAYERTLGELGDIALAGPRASYPMVLIQSERFTDPRVALVGDAARGIHPIAGQGWNLGLRDVGALAEVVIDELKLGLDPGARKALERYQRWRRFDAFAMVTVTDGLTRLFSNDILPLRLARDLGLGLVEHAGPLKKVFMRQAMGEMGDLPALMRA